MTTSQLLQLLLCLACGVLAFFMISRWTKRQTGQNLFTAVRDWFRGLKESRRLKNDPEYRRQAESYAEYDAQFLAFLFVMGKRVRYGRLLEGELSDVVRAKIEEEYLALKRLEGECACRAGQYLAALVDDKISAIAAASSQQLYEGFITPDEVVVFLKDERELCRREPAAAANHPHRSVMRFKDLVRERRAAAAGQK